jgi:hypothetical protein
LVSVGWFLSHTRSEILMNESDQEIYSIFFPEPWQVTLVVHPMRAVGMRAGFFVRESDGSVKSDQSHLEFTLPDRLAGVTPIERPPRERVPAPERRPTLFPRAETSAVPSPRWETPFPSSAPAAMAEPQFLPTERPRRNWMWLFIWAAVLLIGAVLGLRYLMLHTSQEPIALTVVERDGQLQIAWDHSAKPVTTATRGMISVVDGGETHNISLTPKLLEGGKVFYARKSGDVEIRMTVQDNSGRSTQEASRFLGLTTPAPSVNPEELNTLQQERDELDSEVRRLRLQNGAQAARIQQLERTLRILETRLRVDQGREPPQ